MTAADPMDEAHRDAMAAVECIAREDDEGVCAVLNNADLHLVATILATWVSNSIREVSRASGAPLEDVLHSWHRLQTEGLHDPS